MSNQERQQELTIDYYKEQTREYKDMRKVLFKVFGDSENDCYYPDYIDKCLSTPGIRIDGKVWLGKEFDTELKNLIRNEDLTTPNEE